jgi:hypothetical protein
MLNAQRPTLDAWRRSGPGLVETKQWLVAGYDGEIWVTTEIVVELQTAEFDGKCFPFDLAVASLDIA